MALDNNPTGAKLGGTLTVAASKGVATFSGLTLNKVGSGYTLQLTNSNLSARSDKPHHCDDVGRDHSTLTDGRNHRLGCLAGAAGARRP